MKTIVYMKFGSHLYGTNTEESDSDFKGIYMPSSREILLNQVQKSITNNSKSDSTQKNSKDDQDSQFYSLHYFILNLAMSGDTSALDMLHAPDNMIIENSTPWKTIVRNREKFYTKSLSSFVGYARTQASKYGIRGSRLNDAERVLNFIKTNKDYETKSIKLKDVWDSLPMGEHIFKLDPDPNGVRMYEVCGRRIGETTQLAYLFSVVQKFYEAYGLRAQQAANNEGIDWKAVSHALRAAYQMKELLTQKTITFPLKEASFLRDIKQGKYHFAKEVSPLLDSLMIELEELTLKSDLPEKPNRKFWEDFLVGQCKLEIQFYS